MLFADIALARRVEAAECDLVTAAGEEARKRLPEALVIPLAGGAAVFAGAGVPWNKMIGLGFDGLPSSAELERVELEFERRGAPLQAEVSTLADAEVARTLTRRGYQLLGFENVLGRALQVRDAGEGTEGLTIGPVGAGDVAAWVDTMITGFEHADTQGVPSHESYERQVLERVMTELATVPGFRGYLARRKGEVAGGGSLRISGTVALLCGAATLPAHRRRGIQTALLDARLRDAAEAGCDLAIVTVQPGSKSQENVQRQGFSLLYSRAHLVLDQE
jgi:GNAT superfamily N-acetyltransferase